MIADFFFSKFLCGGIIVSETGFFLLAVQIITLVRHV
jgi:hypothetical protein